MLLDSGPAALAESPTFHVLLHGASNRPLPIFQTTRNLGSAPSGAARLLMAREGIKSSKDARVGNKMQVEGTVLSIVLRHHSTLRGMVPLTLHAATAHACLMPSHCW